MKGLIIMMRLDGFGLFVNDMGKMIRFYRDVLGFEIKESENTALVLRTTQPTIPSALQCIPTQTTDIDSITNTENKILRVGYILR